MRCAITLLVIVSGVLSASLEKESVQEFVSGNHKFTSDVYREITKKEKGSFVASPFSAQTILALTNEGARGETAAELIAGLALPSSAEKTHEALKTLLPKLTKSEEKLKLLNANKIYIRAGIELENRFEGIATSIYKSGIENVDFFQNLKAAKIINSWVENNTNHKIHDLVNPDEIDGNTKMILVNTLYFSGEWLNVFSVRQTRKKNFYISDKDHVLVDTMQRVAFLNYYENKKLDAKFVEFPYRGSDVNMVFVLPNEKEGLAGLEEHIDELMEPQEYTLEAVDVQLPKFTIETEIKFIPILQNLGIKKAFQPSADFSGISSTDKDVYISDVLQKAFIAVTESGTEAAAATKVRVGLRSRVKGIPTNMSFHADHPFFYYIRQGDLVLFAGRYY